MDDPNTMVWSALPGVKDFNAMEYVMANVMNVRWNGND